MDKIVTQTTGNGFLLSEQPKKQPTAGFFGFIYQYYKTMVYGNNIMDTVIFNNKQGNFKRSVVRAVTFLIINLNLFYREFYIKFN